MTRHEPIEVDFAVVGIGALLIVVAVITGVVRAGFVRRAQRTTGRVIGHRTSRKSGRRKTIRYLHDVEYHVNDQRLVLHSPIGDAKPMPAGHTVRVLYDPNAPAMASIDRFSDIWFWTLLSGILGIVLVGTGVMMLFLSDRLF